LGLIKCNLVVY